MNYFDYLKAKCVAVKFVAESTESGSLFTQSSWRINDSPNSAVMYKLAKISLNYAETLLCFYSWNQVCLKKKIRKLLKLCNWYVKKVAKKCKYWENSGSEYSDLFLLSDFLFYFSVILCFLMRNVTCSCRYIHET